MNASLRRIAAIAGALVIAAPASAVTYTFYGVITSRLAGPGTLGAFNWAQNSGFNSDGISLARADGNGYAAAFGSTENGGTLSSSAYGSVNAYRATTQLDYDLFFDAPANVKAKVSMTAIGTISAWGSGVASASFSFGGLNKGMNTKVIAKSPGAPTIRSFKWTQSLTVSGGAVIPVFLTAQSSVNTLNAPELYGLGSASSFIDPVVSTSAVPEPAAWGLMIAGFGLVGAVARRRRASGFA